MKMIKKAEKASNKWCNYRQIKKTPKLKNAIKMLKDVSKSCIKMYEIFFTEKRW